MEREREIERQKKKKKRQKNAQRESESKQGSARGEVPTLGEGSEDVVGEFDEEGGLRRPELQRELGVREAAAAGLRMDSLGRGGARLTRLQSRRGGRSLSGSHMHAVCTAGELVTAML